MRWKFSVTDKKKDPGERWDIKGHITMKTCDMWKKRVNTKYVFGAPWDTQIGFEHGRKNLRKCSW